MAVLVRNGCKNYGSAPILENISLTVRPGSIYGLLGASGCGKTTLLSCMIGLKTLDSGTVKVFGNRPGQKGSGVPGPLVGFMPQEIALYPIFTIAEAFAYYGQIYGMTSEEIENRTEFLIKFLQLPEKSTMLDTLSGGESRRISFSLAMIHQPPLLVMDEPTVGLDPLLRQSIWEHMTELVRSEAKTTIIITTHYIQEATSCDMVGIMRRGRLLAEQSPKILMAYHNTNSLENVVLQLCKEDDETNGTTRRRRSTIKGGLSFHSTSNTSAAVPSYDDDNFVGVKLTKIRHILCDDAYSVISKNNNDIKWKKLSAGGNPYYLPQSRQTLSKNLNIVAAQAKKNFIVQIRHPLTLFSQLLLPVFQILLYNTVIGTEPFGQNVAYVSNDWNMWNKSSVDQTLIDFCSNEYKSTSINGTCFKNEMSAICTFLNQFDANDVTWIPTSSVQDSLKLVQRGDVIGFIEFPANLTNHFRDRAMYRNFADNETIDGSAIKLRMDLSDAISSGWVVNKILNRYLGYIKETTISCGQDPRMSDMPMEYNSIYGDWEGQSWITYMQPGVVVVFIFILSNMRGTLWVGEKQIGIADRGTVAGIKFGHIVGGSILSDTMVSLVQIGIMMFMLVTFYGMRLEGSWILALVLIILISLAGQSVGFLFASFINEVMDSVILLLFINALFMACTGVFWPLESVYKYYRIFCLSLPISIPIDAMRAICFRGWGLEHPVVQKGFAVAVGWIVVSLGVSAYVNRRKR